MGDITGRGDKSQEPICTRRADGPAQVYWQALLTGDQGVVAEILSDPQNNLSPNAIFDTSDLEEWKNYRFNFRRLSTWGAAGRWCGVGARSLLPVLQGTAVAVVCYGCSLGYGVGAAARAWGCGWVPLGCLWESMRVSGTLSGAWGTQPF